jgi:hypothetical protein
MMVGIVGVVVMSSSRLDRAMLREPTFHVPIYVELLENELGLGVDGWGWEGRGGSIYVGMGS